MKRNEMYCKLSQLFPAAIASLAWELIGVLTRLHIPDEDKQLELVLALREAGTSVFMMQHLIFNLHFMQSH